MEWGESGRGFCNIHHLEAGDLDVMLSSLIVVALGQQRVPDDRGARDS